MAKKIETIINFHKRFHRMPSYKELAEILKLKSKASAYHAAKKLIEQGLLAKDQKGNLLPTSVFSELPLLGTVSAGWPSPAEEELPDTMSLDEYLINKKEATYLFNVKGDSMVEAGIMDGDLALVERGRTPKDRDIVLAEIDHEWTLKYFRKKGDKVWLEPANKKYKPIYPEEELRVPAVLISIVRKYHV